MISIIAYGFTIGGILYIISVGLSFTFGTMGIVNFSHALIYSLGAYILVALISLFHGSFILGAFIATFSVLPLSYVIERFVIRRLYGKSIDHAIIATYAIFLIGVDVIKWIWGATPIPISDPVNLKFNISDVELPVYRIIVIALSIITFICIEIYMQRSISGKIVTAGLEDKEAVRSLGVNVDKYFMNIFLLGSGLAALGGVLYAPITAVDPYMGFLVIKLSFAVVIVGGLGNLRGTFFSAIILGLVMSITGRFWGPAQEVMVFIVMTLVLIFKL